MNGSSKLPELQPLLDRVRASSAEQQELMLVLLQATWWVKDELLRQSDIFKKHEDRLNALEAGKGTGASPAKPPAHVAPVEVKPESLAPAAATAAATAPDSDLLELGLDLFADLKKQVPAPNLVEEIKATPDPLQQSDPWRERLDLDINGKGDSEITLEKVPAGEKRPGQASGPIGSTRTVNKAAIGARPQDDGPAPPGPPLAEARRPAPKAMPVEIAQNRGARAPREAPSQSLRENLDKVAKAQNLKEKLLAKVVEKESRQETVAALAAKAQTLMGDEGPPGPPAKAAPEGKSPDSKSPTTAVTKASGSRPPAKAPPVALLKRAENDVT